MEAQSVNNGDRNRTVSPVSTGRAKPLLFHVTTIDLSLAVLLATEMEEEVRAGYDVVGVSAPGPRRNELELIGVRHEAISSFTRSWNLRSDAKAFIELYRLFRRLSPDIGHTHTPKAGVFGRIAARLAGVPVVVNTVHGLWAIDSDPPIKRIAVAAVEGFAARFSDAELFQNPEDHRAMRPWFLGRRAVVVGNGTNLDKFQRDLDDRHRVRAEWGVADDEIVVLGVGRLVAEKGVMDLDKAISLAKRTDKARFVWVGPAEPDKADQVLTVKNLTLAGERRDMSAVYSAADIFVLPSHREGFPRSAMEAASVGLPLILTDIRGCREIGRDDHDAVFVPASNPERLAMALDRLLGDVTERETFGRAARQRALDAFDQREIARRSMNAYEHTKTRRRRKRIPLPLPTGQ